MDRSPGLKDERRLTTRWSRPGQPSVWLWRDTSLGLAGRLISTPLGGWFHSSILHISDMSAVKEHMLIHSILPKNEERC